MGANPPPQGPLQPGQAFDDWFLQGVLINAEIERDRIHDARFRQRSSATPFAPSDSLKAAFFAEMRTRAMIEPAALRVALGDCSMAMQSAIIASSCPERFEENLTALADQVALCRNAVERQSERIRWAILPLCRERQPGDRIIATAENVGGPLPRRRIVEICRHVAASTVRKRTAHAGR